MKFFRIALGLGALLSSLAPDASASNWRFFDFRLNQLTVYQVGGNSFSGEFAWAPGFMLGKNFGLRLLGGAALLKAYPTGLLGALDYEALLGIQLSGYSLELGPGAQTWIQTNGGTAASANAVFTPDFTASFQFFLGYTAFFAPQNLTHEIKAGFGFAL